MQQDRCATPVSRVILKTRGAQEERQMMTEGKYAQTHLFEPKLLPALFG